MTPAALHGELLTYALRLPGAYADHPWGEDVAKVGRKVFVFFGIEGSSEPGMSVKLPHSQPLALAQPGATPTGYGLGKSGWVTVRFNDDTPAEMLREWIDESYRAVAPKKHVAPGHDMPPGG
ncbi:MAG: MmcQ/YjbR family DNA-binding protein [Chloroflexota bacterium]|nr:MmcQ/YjbR family DNA-binding protein [Chloroflexota bacterium]